jgi:hypothetical protein
LTGESRLNAVTNKDEQAMPDVRGKRMKKAFTIYFLAGLQCKQLASV